MFGFSRHTARLIALFEAVSSGDRAAAAAALQHDPSLATEAATEGVSKKMPGVRPGMTPVHAAAAANQVAILDLLISLKCDVNLPAADGGTPLYCAAYNAHHASVERLLDAGADINARGPSRRTPLHAAAAAGDPATLRLLLSKGGDTRALDEEQNLPLHLAARSCNASAVTILGRLAEDINVRNSLSASPLHLAVIAGSARGRRVSIEDATDTLEALLKLGADVNASTSAGETPLDVLVARRSDPTIRPLMELLRRHGARCQRKDLPADLAHIAPPPPVQTVVVSKAPAPRPKDPPPLYPRAVIVGAKPLLLGRHHTADLQFTDPTVSLRHARVDRRPGGVYIEDLGSRNGVRINGRRVSGPHRLRPDDVITIGVYHFRFDGGKLVPSAEVPTAAASASPPLVGLWSPRPAVGTGA